MTPEPSNRATTKDILRHEWLAHGPVLSLRLNPTTITTPTSTSTSTTPASVSNGDKRKYTENEKVRLRTTSPTKLNETSVSPTNSLVELELHTSAFYDSAKLRDHNSTKNKEQQRRNRASAFPDTTRNYSSANSKTNSSSSRAANRRPLSLSLDDEHQNNPIDYHFASTSEKPSQISAPSSSSTTQPYTRRSRRTLSPTSTKTSSSTYGNNDSLTSPSTNHRYTLATSTDIKKPTSPINPSHYLVSYDFDTALRDLKRKPLYKYTPQFAPPATDINVVPSLLNSTTPVAPSVFTTSSIKFAPAPTRRISPVRDHDTNSNNSLLGTPKLSTNIKSNTSTNMDDSINTATTNYNNRHSLLTSFDMNNVRKSRLLDDNNNLIPLKVHD